MTIGPLASNSSSVTFYPNPEEIVQEKLTEEAPTPSSLRNASPVIVTWEPGKPYFIVRFPLEFEGIKVPTTP